MRYRILLAFLFVTTFNLNAQTVKFGKITKEDLAVQTYEKDTTASAVYLLKDRLTYFDYNAEEGWIIVDEIHERIKILKKSGLDYATKKISFYEKGVNKEVVKKIEGNVFNLVNGKVDRTKIAKENILGKEINENFREKIIAAPAATVGSVIEWKYIKTSPFWEIEDIVFQEDIPVKRVTATVKVPPYFVFKRIAKGGHAIRPKDFLKKRTFSISFSQSNSYGTSSDVTRTGTVTLEEKVSVYEANDVPALKEEPYTNNIENYRHSITYELSSSQFPNSGIKNYSNTWMEVVKTIYDSDFFGKQLLRTNYFKEDIDELIKDFPSDKDRTDRIYQFVKNKMKWNGRYGKYARENLRTSYKSGVGSSAEINLTLIAMLKYAGVEVYPVLVSTRNYVIPVYPTLEGFNYVVAAVQLNGKRVLLDATGKYSAPDVLPFRALNWHGRMISNEGKAVSLNMIPKKKSVTVTQMSAEIDPNGSIQGKLRVQHTNHYAMFFREKYTGADTESYLEELEKKYNGIEISDYSVKNEKDLIKPLLETYEFYKEDEVESVGDKLYFKPMFYFADKESPLKSENRTYPVDFGFPWESRYMMNIKIPDGYEIESVPEKVAMALPENMGNFSYNIVRSEGAIRLVSSISITKPLIAAAYYSELKEFYDQWVKKQIEGVVLKKI